MTIGERIRAARNEKGLTQYELADLSGLDRDSIYQIERGLRGDIHVSTAQKLAHGLGISVGQLLDETPAGDALENAE